MFYFGFRSRVILPRLINVQSLRMVNLEVPDLEQERLLRRTQTREHFDELFPKIKLPSKLHRLPDLAKEFIHDRLEKNPVGYPKIPLEQYEQLWSSETEDKRESIRNQVEMVLLFYNNVLRMSMFAPSSISMEDMHRMIHKYPTHRSRLRYVNFLFIREFDEYCRQLEEQEASARRKKQREAEMFEHIGCFDPETGDLQYGYWRNTLFTRFFDRSRHRQTLQILRQAEQVPDNTQPLVVDCSLESLMADYEIQSCQRQISNIYHMNRYSRYPFRLLFTGFDPNQNRTSEYLYKNMKDFMQRPETYFNLHQESYQQLLPSERLIYLSPDAREIMTEFDPRAVYIIGALVSKTYKAALTLEKAQAEGLECMRLPLHHYVQLKPCVKRVLSFQCVFQILLMLKHGADWLTAMKNSIPPHKLVGDCDDEDSDSGDEQIITQQNIKALRSFVFKTNHIVKSH